MAFKMKNPSVAKMVKAAGSNRVAMKMKAESAMKMAKQSAMKHANRFGEYHTTERFPGSGPSPGKASDELGHVRHTHKSKTDGTIVTTRRTQKQKERDDAANKDAKSPAKMGHSPKKMKKSAMKVHEKGHKENYVDKKQPDGSIKRQYIFGGPDGQAKSNFKPMEKIEELPKNIKKIPKLDPLPKPSRKKVEAKRASAAKLKKESPAKMGHKSPKKMKKASPKKHLAMNPGFGTMKELKEHNKDVIAPKGDARKDAKNWTHKKKGKQ